MAIYLKLSMILIKLKLQNFDLKSIDDISQAEIPKNTSGNQYFQFKNNYGDLIFLFEQSRRRTLQIN